MSFSRNQIIFFGLVAHVVAAFFSVGYHQSDELFQVYEFAGYRLGINKVEDLPWEFAAQMRSGIQPFLVYGITRCFHFFSVQNPFTIAFFIRLCMSLFAFAATVKLLRVLDKEIRTQRLKDGLWAFGLLFWCLPYFHARFSAENFSASLFVFGLATVLNSRSLKAKSVDLFLAGAFFGVAFFCRFQMSFMIAGLLFWLIFIDKLMWQRLLLIVAGMLVAAVFGFLGDKWLYGQWVASPWNYLDLNLFQGKASEFGREPFYFYILESLVQLIPPFSIFIIAAVIFFWLKFSKHVITWITLPFVLLHFCVAHKELRFLFPMLNFLPFMILYCIQFLRENSVKAFKAIDKKWILNLALAVNAIVLTYFMLKPADNISYMQKKIYEIVQGDRPILLYENTNPYNNIASLNYFRNAAIRTQDLKTDTADVKENKTIYYFSEKFGEQDAVVKNKKTFIKLYSNFPVWVSYLNFNGWLERTETFSIYKMKNTVADL